MRCNFNKNKNYIEFLLLNRFCFNSVYRENHKGEFNIPYNNKDINCDFISESFEYNIKKIKEYLYNNDISMYNTDYLKILSKAYKGDFVYLDPLIINKLLVPLLNIINKIFQKKIKKILKKK